MVAESGKARRASAEWALIATFLATLVAPFAARSPAVAEEDRALLLERRLPAPPARLEATVDSVRSFPERFDAFYADTFGFREELVRGVCLLRWFGLGLSPTPVMVRGRDGWAFFADEHCLEVFRGTLPLSPAELEGWARMLEDRRDRLAAHGVAYVYAIAPNKHTVYADRMPPEQTVVGPTRLEQLLVHAAGRPDFPLLDLRPALAAERERDDPAAGDFAYYPLGTHWQDRGAYAAYRALVARLAEQIAMPAPLAREDCDYALEDGQGDSWARRMYLEGAIVQSKYGLTPRAPRAVRRGGPRALRTRVPGGDGPRAVVLHDSFGNGLKPYLPESFSHATFLRTYDFDLDEVLAERPEVVVEVVVERTLQTLSPWIPGRTGPAVPALDPADLARRFGSSDEALLTVDVRANRPGFEPFGAPRITPGSRAPDGLLWVHTSAPQDLVALPAVAVPAGRRAALRLDFSSPLDTSMDMVWLRPDGPVYDPDHALRVPVRKGRNEVVVPFAPPVAGARLLIRPGLRVRKYRFRAVEVRALP